MKLTEKTFQTGNKHEKNAPDSEGNRHESVAQGLVSKPQQDVVAGKWTEQVGAAKIAWGKLTNDELLQSRGEVQKLSGLIQQRYGLSAINAERKVKKFFEKA